MSPTADNASTGILRIASFLEIMPICPRKSSHETPVFLRYLPQHFPKKSILVKTTPLPSASSVRGDAFRLVRFCLDDGDYALHLAAVERIVRIAEVTALPKAPGIVRGVINVHGRVIPVFDARKRFGLPGRDLLLSDVLILARASRRTIAMIVDAVVGIVECTDATTTTADDILPNLEYIEGVIKLKDGLILVHDLDSFLSLEEEKSLEQAMMSN